MPGFPFEMTIIIIAAVTSALLALVVFLFLVINRVIRATKVARLQHIEKISVTQHFLRFISTAIWFLLSLVVLFLAVFVQSYRNFTKEEIVAIVTCDREDDQVMLLTLTTVKDDEEGEPEGFLVYGDQWALEGNILRWDEWLNFAGLHTMFKLTRVTGRYLNPNEEIDKKRTVHSLANEEEDTSWRWLFEYGQNLRFVHSSYGNTVYTYPAEDKTFEIFVTTSGFSMRAQRREPRN